MALCCQNLDPSDRDDFPPCCFPFPKGPGSRSQSTVHLGNRALRCSLTKWPRICTHDQSSPVPLHLLRPLHMHQSFLQRENIILTASFLPPTQTLAGTQSYQTHAEDPMAGVMLEEKHHQQGWPQASHPAREGHSPMSQLLQTLVPPYLPLSASAAG